MRHTNKHWSVLCTLLVGGVLFSVISGCAGGNPFMGEAEEQLENQNYEQALVSVDSALARNPKNAEAYLLKSRILTQQARTVEDPAQHADLVQQAREAQEQALEINPGLRGDIQTRRQMAYIQEMQQGANLFNQAQKQQNQEQYRAAAAYFNAASIIFPDSASAHLNEAYALINAGNQSEAIGPMEEYVEASDSVGASNYQLLGQLYLTNDRMEDAIPLLEEAAEQYPDNQDIQSLLLNAYNQSGQQEQAIQAYEKQVERNPQNALYRYNLGSLYLNTEQYDKAIDQLTRALEIDPQNSNAQYNLGAAYVNKAVAINDSIRAIEDELRQQENEVTKQRQQQLNTEAQELAERRRQLFEQAIPPLERARQLSDEGNTQRICSALYTAYVQTEQMEEAREVESCAGN